MTRPIFLITLLGSLLSLGWGAAPSSAQPLLFGSLDDPYEVPRRAWWLKDRYAEGSLGLSLVGAQWRTSTRLRARIEVGRSGGELDGSIRAGLYGPYDPDTDETYDLLRVVRFVRLQGRPGYLRLGPVTRARTGQGLLVDFLNGTAVWDERTIGTELALTASRLQVFGVATDLRMDRLLAGRVEIRPLPGRGRLGSIWIGGGMVTDRSLTGSNSVTAFEADLRMTAATLGDLSLRPFVGAAEFRDRGHIFSVGTDFASDNVVDLARFHSRVALEYAERGVRPGFFGSFYDVQNPLAVTLSPEKPDGLAGVRLSDSRPGTYLRTELRVHLFERLEFFYAFRRFYGSQALSTYHLRIFLRTPSFLFAFSEDRGGLRGILSLFNDLGDESVMSFRTDYRLTGPLWLRVDARYGYLRILELDETARFSVQRRFEPYVGVRLAF